MKRRIAKKIILNLSRYTSEWYHPERDEYVCIPKNGRCWYLIQKASCKMKKPQIVDMIVENFEKVMQK